MSVEIAWKQNILVTDFHLLKSLLVVFGFGSQAFVCGFSRQNINSVLDIPHRSTLIYVNDFDSSTLLRGLTIDSIVQNFGFFFQRH